MKKPQYAPDQNLAAAVLPHDAYWSIEPAAGRRLWQIVQTETFAAHIVAVEARAATAKQDSSGDDKPYEMRGSTAIFHVSGPMTKAPTSMSMGTSTVRTRRAIRQAKVDSDVAGAVIRFDTPGGAYFGTSDLAADIADFARVKPILGYAEDSCCSAGLWAASQCSALYSNPTAMVGSLGTIMVMDDTSRLAQNLGVEVLVFGSGAYKGAGTDGTAITPDQRAYFQAMVDNLNSHFLAAVKRGRNLSDEQLIALTDARVHVGQAAMDMGLVDGICSLDDVLNGAAPKRIDAKTTAKGSTDRGITQRVPARATAAGTEERSKMRNPLALFNVFKAGVAAGEGDTTEEGDDSQALAPVFIGAPRAAEPAKIDLSTNPEYMALKAQNETLTAQMTAQAGQIALLSASMATQVASAQYVTDEARVESLVRQMKMTPAEASGWKTLAKDNPAAFAASFVTQESRPVLFQLKGDAVRAKMANTGDPGAQLAALTSARAKQDKISHAQAAVLVAQENPDLARAHNAGVPTLSVEGAN